MSIAAAWGCGVASAMFVVAIYDRRLPWAAIFATMGAMGGAMALVLP